MFEVDLHIHSIMSDGIYTKNEIFNFAKQNNVKVISITDHDTIDVDVSNDLSTKYEILHIPGIELTTNVNKGVHILGYFSNERISQINNDLNTLKFKRARWLLKVLKKFNETVSPIVPDDIINRYGQLSVKNVAEYIKYLQICENTDEVYEKYLDNLDFAQTELPSFSPYEAIKFIEKHNGISFLAHPYIIDQNGIDIWKLVSELKEYGLNGIECFHPTSMTNSKYNDLIRLAETNKLLISGGSDFHGTLNKSHSIGSCGITMDLWSTLKFTLGGNYK